MRPARLLSLCIIASAPGCPADDPPQAATEATAALLPLLANARTSPPLPLAAGFRILHEAKSVAAELAADAAAPFRVTAMPGAATVLRRTDARPARGHIERGAVFYPEALPGADVIVRASAGGVEEIALVHETGARVAYELELSPCWQAVRAAVPGLVEVRDGSGSARLRMWARRAWDARGRGVPIEPVVERRSERRFEVRISFDEAQVADWPVAVDQEWTPATDLTIARSRHTATPLPDGRVLLAGGDAAQLGLAETYDPRTGTFTSTGPMTRRRAAHTATLLPSGLVLLAGGDATSFPTLTPDATTDTTEIFDPASGTFIAAAPMLAVRSHHTATLLGDGRVLFAGGLGENGTARADAELYDGDALAPATPAKTFALSAARVEQGAVLLPGGRVLLGGGNSQAPVAEIVDPAAPGTTSLGTFDSHLGESTVTLLPSGEVLIAGSNHAQLDPSGDASGELGACSACAAGAAATLLPSGRVLLVGGREGDSDGPAWNKAVLYDPRGPALLPTGPMTRPRVLATATLLSSGAVLIAGGYSGVSATASAELYDSPEVSGESTGAMLEPRCHHTATLLDTGEVLIAGGEKALDGGLYGPVGAEIYVSSPPARTPPASSGRLAP